MEFYKGLKNTQTGKETACNLPNLRHSKRKLDIILEAPIYRIQC